MPSGCVIEREGKRGTVFYLWFRDADGKQVKTSKTEDGRTMRAADGWTRKRAERELGVRLDRVGRDRWTKPTQETFAAFAEEWRTKYLPARRLKRSTLIDYANTLDRHAIPFFGDLALEAIGPEHFDDYIGTKLAAGLSPKTVTNHLATLDVVFKVAKRWKRVRANPLDDVERPRAEDPQTVILTEDEIAALIAAYTDLAFGAPVVEQPWWDLTRRMVLVVLGTALRRGELLALRWQDVELLDRRAHVRRAWVRNQMTTPKSRASRRTVPFGLKTKAALEEQWQASRHRRDDHLVFGHPELGTPLDPSELTRSYVKPALKRAGITKPLQPWHGLRHTALTMDAAVGNPNAYLQAKAGHAQFSITERYIHAAQVAFPGAVERAEARMFGDRREANA